MKIYTDDLLISNWIVDMRDGLFKITLGSKNPIFISYNTKYLILNDILRFDVKISHIEASNWLGYNFIHINVPIENIVVKKLPIDIKLTVKSDKFVNGVPTIFKEWFVSNLDKTYVIGDTTKSFQFHEYSFIANPIINSLRVLEIETDDNEINMLNYNLTNYDTVFIHNISGSKIINIPNNFKTVSHKQSLKIIFIDEDNNRVDATILGEYHSENNYIIKLIRSEV